MTPREWLRSSLVARWWSLPDDQFRVGLTLVAMSDSDGRVATTYGHLVVVCRMPRTSVRRALQALSAAGFCAIEARAGRGGETVVVITDRGSFGTSELVDSTEQFAPGESQADLLDTGPRIFSTVNSGPLQSPEMLCESLADLGDRGHLIARNPDLLQVITPEIRPISSRASDLDLQQSSGSDLRSPDSQDLTSLEKQKVRPKARRVDPLKVPPRAWAAADYLRRAVLQVNAAAFVGTKPWDKDVGLRLAWANSFRLLGDQTLRAMKNAGPATDGDAWDAIAKTVSWLFNGQGPSHRFVVESPDSLREKWDQIQAVRRNKQSQPARGSDGRPDPIATREYKRLTPGDL